MLDWFIIMPNPTLVSMLNQTSFTYMLYAKETGVGGAARMTPAYELSVSSSSHPPPSVSAQISRLWVAPPPLKQQVDSSAETEVPSSDAKAMMWLAALSKGVDSSAGVQGATDADGNRGVLRGAMLP